jgi:uncharacterized protein
MAGKFRPFGKGISIGAVYTPPQNRRHGYATAVVSGLCRELLSSGYSYCALYTDLSNPTSNSIYKKIGFAEVCDSVMVSFKN